MSDPSVAFIDTSAQSAAVPFYGIFPNEPIPGAGASTVAVGSSPVDIRDRSVEGLCKRIVNKVKPNGSILIVSHGNLQGLLLNFGKSKNRVFLEFEAMRALRLNMTGKAADAETAQILMMTPAELASLKTAVAAVQKLELDRVDIRACNTGRNDVAMSELQLFFNCDTVCAPTIYDSFGIIRYGSPTQDPGFWKAWFNKNPGARMEGLPPNRFAYNTVYTPSFMIEALAESDAAITTWVGAHLPSGSYSGGPLFFHAFTDLRDQPIFAGDATFRSKLQSSYKGKTPSRQIDLDKMPVLPPP